MASKQPETASRSRRSPIQVGAPPTRPAREFVLYRMPGHLIRRLQQVAVSLLIDEFAAVGSDLTPVQYAALFGISAHPNIDQASLAGLIAFDRATIGGVIDRLESKGLIRRTVSTRDRRLRQLVTERAGEKLLDTLAPAVQRAQERILQPLGARERAAFVKSLARMVIENNEHSRVPMRPIAPRRAKRDTRVARADGSDGAIRIRGTQRTKRPARSPR